MGLTNIEEVRAYVEGVQDADYLRVLQHMIGERLAMLGGSLAPRGLIAGGSGQGSEVNPIYQRPQVQLAEGE